MIGALCLAPAIASADEPLTQAKQWSGTIDFFATGTTLVDRSGGSIKGLLSPASVDVTEASIPAGVVLENAYVYWTGTRVQGSSACAPGTINDTGNIKPPGASAFTSVTAESCKCVDGINVQYDMVACRADVTSVVAAAGGTLTGSYSFNSSFTDDDVKKVTSGTANASFSIVLVFRSPALKQRRITLSDGLITMWSSSGANPMKETVSITGIKVDNPPRGDLTWYVAEGDISPTPEIDSGERVTVRGFPGNRSSILSDSVNQKFDPMNETINTVSPAITDSVGVDIDQFDISSALSADDSSLEIEYSAGQDKWWLVYNIVGINVYVGELQSHSRKDVLLLNDSDANSVPSKGDTVRYTIHLENTGNAPISAQIVDEIPAVASTWQLVSAGGGKDVSGPTTLAINAVPVEPYGFADVIFDMIIGDVPDQTPLTNTASFDGRPTGDMGTVTAPELLVRSDTDHDGVFDKDDDCPAEFDPEQVDLDDDGIGDACDWCPNDPANDSDSDGVCQNDDNCENISNANQKDTDKDGRGDACDFCYTDPTNDADGDGICQDVDNCPSTSNTDQMDTDQDGIGDACDKCPKDVNNLVDDNGSCDADRRRTIKTGCDCGTGMEPSAFALLMLVASLRRRRNEKNENK